MKGGARRSGWRGVLAAVGALSGLGGVAAQTPPTLDCSGFQPTIALFAADAGQNDLWRAASSDPVQPHYPRIEIDPATGNPTTAGYAAEACEAPAGSTQAQIDQCAAMALVGTDYTGTAGADRRASCETTAPCVYVARGSRARHPDTGWPYAPRQLVLSADQEAGLSDGDGGADTLGAGITVSIRVCADQDLWCAFPRRAPPCFQCDAAVAAR